MVLRHPTCASCVAWMCCRMSNSIKHECSSPDQLSRRGHWSIIEIMLFFVLRHPTCVSCVAWMCCRMSTSINKQVWSMSRSIIAASASILIEIMLLLVLRHPTCVSCVAWIVVGCPILSSTYAHVPIFHFIVMDSTPSYTLCALTSHPRVRCSSGLKQLANHPSHVTYSISHAKHHKIRRGRYCFIVRPSVDHTIEKTESRLSQPV